MKGYVERLWWDSILGGYAGRVCWGYAWGYAEKICREAILGGMLGV